MIKIGLIGEDPNDTDSIKNLLLQKLDGKVLFTKLLKNRRGHQLDNIKTINLLKIEFKDKKPDLVVFIRDVDGIETEKEKIKKTQDWYNLLSKEVSKKLLLLNIYELESLIIADINCFNKIYGTTIKNKRDVNFIKEPKEFLIRKSSLNKKKFNESDCPDLFQCLDINIVAKNCKYFNTFLIELSNYLNIKII